MAVKVNVDLQISCLVLVDNRLLSCVNSRLPLRIRVQVKPIQVVVVCVQPEVPPRHSIRIKQWYNLELIFFEQEGSLLRFRKQKLKYAIEHMGCTHFARVHSSREEYGWFFIFNSSLLTEQLLLGRPVFDLRK